MDMASAARSFRYHPLGTFRLFLAGLVVVQHVVANMAPIGGLYHAVLPFEFGSLAVLVFFALSGFVITEAACLVYVGKPVPFMTNRLLRIVPHFLVALALAMAIDALFDHAGTLRLSDREFPSLPPGQAFDLRTVLGNVVGFLPGANRLMGFDFISIIWAVRIEMIFYGAVFLALLLPAPGLLRRAAPAALVVLGLLTCLVHYKFGYAFFFLFGACLYDYRANAGDAPQVRRALPLLLCCAGMALHLLLIPMATKAGYDRAVLAQAIILAALLALMTVLALTATTPRPRDQRCGDLSYPVYIHHENAVVIVLSLTAGYSYPAMLAGVALALALSYGLMLAVDPIVNRLRDAVRGRSLDRAPDRRGFAANNAAGARTR